jgi:alcohol dehydrogenase class IV
LTQFNGHTKICYGENAIGNLDKLTGRHAFIVTDPFMVKMGFTDRVISCLERAEITHSIFAEVEPNPSLETVQKGTVKLLAAGADLIIALGGGSAIDAAKAMMYFAYQAEPAKGKPTLVVIPTTSGTGSEVTAFSVITDTERQVKIPLIDDLLLPDMAVLDARFTRSVPPAVTAVTGMDVLVHALEAYVSTPANAFTDLYAVHAIKYVFRYLLRCYRNGDDMEARQNMLLASCMAGMAFNNSGLGVAHSIAHTLGGIFHIPHGKANAVLLPYVIRFNSFDVRERYRTIASELDLPSDSVEQGNESLIEAVRWLNSQMDIPNRIRDLGIKEDEFNNSLDVMANNAMDDRCTATNPRRPSKRDLTELLRKAY